VATGISCDSISAAGKAWRRPQVALQLSNDKFLTGFSSNDQYLGITTVLVDCLVIKQIPVCRGGMAFANICIPPHFPHPYTALCRRALVRHFPA
jgi:hypothetical protein